MALQVQHVKPGHLADRCGHLRTLAGIERRSAGQESCHVVVGVIALPVPGSERIPPFPVHQRGVIHTSKVSVSRGLSRLARGIAAVAGHRGCRGASRLARGIAAGAGYRGAAGHAAWERWRLRKIDMCM